MAGDSDRHDPVSAVALATIVSARSDGVLANGLTRAPVCARSIAMDSLLISAASGMKARMESLDMLANNIANSGTVGFKTDREFYGIYQQELPVIEKQWTDFSQGALTPTGNPLDLALSGKGMFALNTP